MRVREFLRRFREVIMLLRFSENYILRGPLAEADIATTSRDLAVIYARAQWKWYCGVPEAAEIENVLQGLMRDVRKRGNISCGGLRLVLDDDGVPNLLLHHDLNAFV